MEYLDEVIKEYLDNNKVDTSRGYCFIESESLYWYIADLGDENIDLDDLKVVEGYFEIDYPEKLPLTFQDLYSDEYEMFLDLYDDNFSLYSEEELSEVLWEFINRYLDKSRFYIIPHGWLEYQGEIIDITREQFKNAIKNFKNIEDRYI